VVYKYLGLGGHIKKVLTKSTKTISIGDLPIGVIEEKNSKNHLPEVDIMPIQVVQLGTPRKRGEGLRIGTVRRPPRGVLKKDYARLDYFDVWLPELAPSADLMSQYRSGPFTEVRWKQFARRYRSEMSAPDKSRMLDVFAALSHQTDFSVGCYCEDEEHCHRSELRRVLQEHGAKMV
jgi:uncharacterized protein YeaO (DUF488 family)